MSKISILITNLIGGGAERVVVNLANALHRRGYSVDVVLLRAEGVLLEQLDCGVCIVNLNVARFRGALLPLVRYLRRERPDALLANMWPLTLTAILARDFQGSHETHGCRTHYLVAVGDAGPSYRRLASTWVNAFVLSSIRFYCRCVSGRRRRFG